MKRFSFLFLLVMAFVTATAGTDKTNVIDHYFINFEGQEVERSFALFEIKVVQDADSIKVYTSYADSRLPYSLETFKVLNDSVQIRWGTQVIYHSNGVVKRYQYIDELRGIDNIYTYSEAGVKETHIVTNIIFGESLKETWYPTGFKKSQTIVKRELDGTEMSSLTWWHPNSNLMRKQTMVDHKTQELQLFDEQGLRYLSIPCHTGDSIFINAEGAATTRAKAKNIGVVALEADSINITTYNLDGRKLSRENFRSYTPEESQQWGTQRYYYTSTPQPVDSLVVFRAVTGDNLSEMRYYPDGKLLSTTNLTFDAVMIPIKELRQYDTDGHLRRVQRHHGNKLIEGHMYDSEGKETEFFEYKE